MAHIGAGLSPSCAHPRVLWAAVFVLVLSAAGAGSAGRQDWRAQGLAAFDATWQTVDDTYYDPAFGGLDWAAVRAELRPRAESAETPEAVRGVIREMLARLGQSHFVLLAPSPDAEPWPGDALVPIEIRVTAAGVVIVRVEAASAAERAGLRPGDRLEGVDQLDARTWLAAAAGVDERARRLDVWQRAFRALHGSAGSTARVRVRSPSGSERTADVTRTRPTGEVVALGNLPPLPVRTAATVVPTPTGRRVGVVAFSVWMAAVSEPFASAVDAYRDADGVVIDLRGNPGGLAEMMRGIAGHFLAQPALLGRVRMRGVSLEFRANPRRSTRDGRRVEPFAGPLAVLVDELTASTSECFAGALQGLGRARVFGRRTMGQALPASTRQLPNGDVLMYAVGDFVTSTGRRLEGEGVVPDEAVPVSVEALAEGRDPSLEAALAWIDVQ